VEEFSLGAFPSLGPLLGAGNPFAKTPLGLLNEYATKMGYQV
jgi:hypothetical protein